MHPFDDPDVVAGQGSVGLELLDQVEDLARVVVPVGGGGLASGIAIAVKSARPEVEVVGVQAAACAPYPESLRRGEPVPVDRSLTIADGIAVKRPGELTLGLLGRWLDGMAVVAEEETAEAMVLLMERCKLVVEGAGAVSSPRCSAARWRPRRAGTTVALLSGGNVDAGLLATIARRHETEAGRRLVLLTRLPDRPGSLHRLLGLLAETGANVVDVAHVREGLDLHVRETAVELVLETRGRDHARRGAGGARRRGLRGARPAVDGGFHGPTGAWRRPAAPDRHPPEGPVLRVVARARASTVVPYVTWRAVQHCSPRAGGARHPRGIHQSAARPRNPPSSRPRYRSPRHRTGYSGTREKTGGVRR